MASSPTGINITKGKRKWKVGKVLGRGACATVCSLKILDNGSYKETDFAVKLAPLPKKKTRKGNSPGEMNTKLLYYEQLVYTTQFQSLQGNFIPRVPNSSSSKDPPVYGDENGYRFFVMEKMESTISSVVPLLMEKPSSKSINIGLLAVKLLECVRAVHESRNVIRDVKTENFMLALSAGATGSTLEKKLASRVRLIDLAMATQWTTMYYEADEGDNLIGTPLYASLNLHAGKKSAFRDDLESLGYVIAEILIQLYSGDPSKQLPWSEGKSDEDIGSLKKSLVEDKSSEFYKKLGNAKTIAAFSEYMEIVRGYSFKQVPEYGELSAILSTLTVPRERCTITTPGQNKSSSKKPASTKRTRSKASTNADGSLSKVARRITRSTKYMDIDDGEECATNNHDQSFDESVYFDAQQESEEMDWEYTVDENNEPKGDSKAPQKTQTRRDPALRRQKTTRSGKAVEKITSNEDSEDEKGSSAPTANCLKRRGVFIFVLDGPHKGDSFEMEAGVNEIVTIGSKPASKVGEVWSLKKDKSLQASHIRLDLSINRKLTAVKVTDKSKGETYVNRHAVKSTKAFINDTVTIGKTSFKIQPL